MINSKEYLEKAQSLLDSNEFTDGCSVPLIRDWIHEKLKKSKLLCAAHDYGNLGKIPGVRAGWHNNLHTFFAHWSINIGYGAWGTIVSLATLPWSVWRRNLGITFMPIMPFHGALLLILAIAFLVIKFQG